VDSNHRPTRRGARIAHAGGRHASNRIDAVIALATAVDRAENRPEPVRLVVPMSTTWSRSVSEGTTHWRTFGRRALAATAAGADIDYSGSCALHGKRNKGARYCADR
jgi:hypothetical protein